MDTEKVAIRQTITKGCGLASNLFNIYIDDIRISGKFSANASILLNKSTCVNALLFANYQIIIKSNEDDLQRYAYILYKI